MKYLIKAEILTPTFVGSGHAYDPMIDFIHFREDKVVNLVDPEKFLKLIGTDKVDQWVNLITSHAGQKKGKADALETWVRGLRQHLRVGDIGDTCIPVKIGGQGKIDEVVKAMIKSGSGDYLIPGSSLKGSLRTAMFMQLLPKQGVNRQKYVGRNKKDWEEFKDNGLESSILQPEKERSDGPNKDLFRFIQVSDFTFKEAVVCRTDTIIKEHNGVTDRSQLRVFIEAIPSGQIGLGSINIADVALTRVKEKTYMQKGLDSVNLKKLFAAVNKHTLTRIDYELSFFDAVDGPKKDAYLDKLRYLKEQVPTQSDAHTCIIRVGAGTGFLNTTGGWQEEVLKIEDQKKLAKQARRKPNATDELPFPKSRRIVEDGTPLGFVKLSVIDEQEAKSIRLQQATSRTATISATSAASNVAVVETPPEPPKPIGPQWFVGPNIKKGAILQAVVIGHGEGRSSQVEVYLKEQETVMCTMLDYPKPEIGKTVEVTVDEMQGKKVTRVRYRRFL